MEKDEIKKAVLRAAKILSEESEYPVDFPDEAAEIISRSCGGDVRKAMNSVELCFASAELADGVLHSAIRQVFPASLCLPIIQ